MPFVKELSWARDISEFVAFGAHDGPFPLLAHQSAARVNEKYSFPVGLPHHQNRTNQARQHRRHCISTRRRILSAPSRLKIGLREFREGQQRRTPTSRSTSSGR